jgi:hypothetical protein
MSNQFYTNTTSLRRRQRQGDLATSMKMQAVRSPSHIYAVKISDRIELFLWIFSAIQRKFQKLNTDNATKTLVGNTTFTVCKKEMYSYTKSNGDARKAVYVLVSQISTSYPMASCEKKLIVLENIVLKVFFSMKLLFNPWDLRVRQFDSIYDRNSLFSLKSRNYHTQNPLY